MMMGPSDVSNCSAMVSPVNVCVMSLWLMSGFISIATPELTVPVLWVYVMYGWYFNGLFWLITFVCARRIMSGSICANICCSACLFCFHPLMF